MFCGLTPPQVCFFCCNGVFPIITKYRQAQIRISLQGGTTTKVTTHFIGLKYQFQPVSCQLMSIASNFKENGRKDGLTIAYLVIVIPSLFPIILFVALFVVFSSSLLFHLFLFAFRACTHIKHSVRCCFCHS